MRRYLVAGNWKLNMGPAAGRRLAADLKELLAGRELKGDVLVCPPFVSIPAVGEIEPMVAPSDPYGGHYPPPPVEGSFDLRRYIDGVMRRKWLLVVGLIAGTLGAAWAWKNTQVTYTVDVQGDVDVAAMTKALEWAESVCHVVRSLKEPVPVEMALKLNGEAVETA